MNFNHKEIKLESLTDKQQSAVKRAMDYLAAGGSTAQNIKVIDVEGMVFVTFHIGDSEEARWFEDHYQLQVGNRGKITIIGGPKRFEESWNNKVWCGIHVKIK